MAEDAEVRRGSGKVSDLPLQVPPLAPDIAIDGFEGTADINGMIRLNLFRVRADIANSTAIREVVATLSMTLVTANQFHKALGVALQDGASKAE